MVYRGTVRDGTVVLETGVVLPNGLEVMIHPVQATHAIASPLQLTMRNGVPVFPRNRNGVKSDLDLVNKLRDETL